MCTFVQTTVVNIEVKRDDEKPKDFILGWATFLLIERDISVFLGLFQNRGISILSKFTPRIQFYLCTGIHFLTTFKCLEADCTFHFSLNDVGSV